MAIFYEQVPRFLYLSDATINLNQYQQELFMTVPTTASVEKTLTDLDRLMGMIPLSKPRKPASPNVELGSREPTRHSAVVPARALR